MPAREVLVWPAAAATAAAGLALTPVVGAASAVSTAVVCATVAALAVLPAVRRHRLGWWLLVPGVVSLALTAWVLLADPPDTTAGQNVAVLEVIGLLVVLTHAARWTRTPLAYVVVAVGAAAQTLWLLRYMPVEERTWITALVGCALWSLWAFVAVVFGAYPRWAAARERRSIERARAAQQRQFERDLHDYVAHDISAMIVQAQAARYAAAGDPSRLVTALERIEEAGQRAMSSMDRALSLLRDSAGAGRASRVRNPGLEDLAGLLERFGTGTHAPVGHTVHGELASVPREVSEELYRVCVEALTNVQRHAADRLQRVDVVVEVGPDTAGVEVTDLTAGSPQERVTAHTGRPGGTGLAQLEERLARLRGTLAAGPTGTGWRVAATVPFGGPG